MKVALISLSFLLYWTAAESQVRMRLNYNKQWELTTPEKTVYIRAGIFDTTSGFFAGPVIDMYLSGKPQMKGSYKQTKKDGEFIFYYPNGNIESTGMFENDNRIGNWKYFHRNGQLKMEAEFIPVLGDEARIHYLSDSLGNKLILNGTGKWIENIQYSNGITATITGEFRNFEKHGTWTFKVSDDKATRVEEFEDGKFRRGYVRGIPSGRMKIEEPLEYGVYLPDKFVVTENFVAELGVSFETYPILKKIVVEGQTIFNVGRIAPSDSNEIFTIVEKPASPPEGMNGFYQFLAQTMNYPAAARARKQQGSVFVEFVIEKDGSFSDIHVVKGIGAECDAEAIRVVQEYSKDHKWVPGTQKGKAVKTRMVLPISFRLGGS